jgi:oxygen-independent coproporphyrinogen-3 oxidase
MEHKGQYVRAIIKEIELYKDDEPTDTIYFGGGTPSILEIQSLSEILETTHRYNNIDSDSEITLEINPGTVDSKKISELKEIGFNRINIGIQSFNDNNLKFLGRIHSSDEALKSFENARKAGFENVGIDIIYGLPGQSINNLISDLKKAIEINPEHISAYTLTYEDNTPLKRKLLKRKFNPLEEGSLNEYFTKTSELLKDNGYNHYEISNFAKANKHSRHNTKYWNLENYRGFGPSAHSFKNNERWWNLGSLEEYLKNIKSGKTSVLEKENLDIEQQMIEAVYLGLRQSKGINIKAFEDKFSCLFFDTFKNLKVFEEDGLMILNNRHCSLNTKGMILHDSIASNMINSM